MGVLNSANQTPLFLAVCHGRKGVVEYLLKQSKLNQKEKNELLQAASVNGHADLVQLIISNGAEV